MSTVKESQAAIEKLCFSDRGLLTMWFNGWEDDDWDREMSRDFAAGGCYARVPERVDDEIKRGPLLDPL